MFSGNYCLITGRKLLLGNLSPGSSPFLVVLHSKFSTEFAYTPAPFFLAIFPPVKMVFVSSINLYEFGSEYQNVFSTF
jgi:hypothetical protein